ncbi:MAG: DNA adenine methylase [Candidatus Saganbacteria bacterium]|nr:DNA adenine methylase [Candidatus Saganbacteria bacterium]
MNNQILLDFITPHISEPSILQLEILGEEPSRTQDIFRPIHYLGSKLRLVESIKNIIDDLDPSGGCVCDLFAGSGTVSKYLSYTRPVISVDIQEYSRVLCSALLNSTIMSNEYEDFVNRCIQSSYLQDLYSAIEPLISYEATCVNRAAEGDSLALCELLENASIYGYEQGFIRPDASALNLYFRDVLTRLRETSVKQGTRSLITRYYGGLYFSYKQAVQMDSILELIPPSPGIIRDLLLAALLSTASEIVNTIGKQFAQPLKPRKSDGTPKKNIGQMVKRDRNIDVFPVYKKWLKRYNIIEKTNYVHKIYRMDYSDALDRLNSDVKVVYADPPYTRDHYSRYYHVLETISLRDVPSISMNAINGKTNVSRGLYRKDRHQSPFCIKSKVAPAFESLFAKTRKIGASLVLSYSPYETNGGARPRLMTIDQLLLLAHRYYAKVELLSVAGFSHSKLNCSDKNYGPSRGAESFIVCKG